MGVTDDRKNDNDIFEALPSLCFAFHMIYTWPVSFYFPMQANKSVLQSLIEKQVITANNIYCNRHCLVTEFWMVSIEYLRRVWHADRGRSLLRTPSPVLWDLHIFYLLRPILFRTCRYFTGLCSSNIPRYFLDFALYSFCGIHTFIVSSYFTQTPLMNITDDGKKMTLIFSNLFHVCASRFARFICDPCPLISQCKQTKVYFNP